MNTLLNEVFKPKDDMTYQQATLYSREVLQKIILNGLSRGGFFKKAAFHGGTALRILHSLDRYSEDLDFSLFQKDLDFRLERYVSYAESEVGSYGLNVTTKVRDAGEGNIRTGNIGCNARELTMVIGFPEKTVKQIHSGQVFKVKIDVNVYPPEGARYIRYSMSDPQNYYLCALDLPSMFAGKTAAVLSRGWNDRIKGRDLYDYLWYVQNCIPLNMTYLRSNLVRQGVLDDGADFDLSILQNMLKSRFESIDYRSAKDDISRFVLDDAKNDGWGSQMFIKSLDNLRVE